MMDELVTFPENHINDKNKRGFTPFLVAIENGYLNIAKLLHRKGANVNLLSNQGQSALHIACFKNYLNCVQFLVERTDINQNQLLFGGTRSNCLHLAVKEGHLRIVKYLFQSSKVNLRQLTTNHDDLLMIAIINGDYPMFKYLLYETVKFKYSEQLDFCNGNGDPPDDLYLQVMQVKRPDYLVDLHYRFRHKTSLL